MASDEARTRKELVDPALQRAGWDVGNPQQVGLEIPVDGSSPVAWKELQRRGKQHGLDPAALPPGICDYALYRANGEVIAVVEAKKTAIDPRLAETQAIFYAEKFAERQSFTPFVFLTNGHDIYFLDAGGANKRLVPGFFSPDDLERLLMLRQRRQRLTAFPINTAITDRAYQHEAIRRVSEAFEAGRRKALLVMATGTGKTRTVMSLVELFLRSYQAQNILFIADRDALVQQAMDEGFSAFIPSEPATRITTQQAHELRSKRLFVVTLQTMSSRYRDFTPGFFDLIIFDEVHRSIFNRWSDVLHYFDARMIGLTATPAGFLDRNTFLAFGCDDQTPTFLYSYEEAIREGYLVDYSLRVMRTKFQRAGIRGVDLDEEARNMLIAQGIDPDEVDFAGSELETKVSNTDTIRKQWAEFMDACYYDASGLPGKTIVFAMTQDHALRLAKVFEEMYPKQPGLVSVITHKSNYRNRLIEDFKRESLPRIAISVDMLETGVNVPEVVNLVFMRPIQSQIKLMQMLGRGTRSQAACRHLEWLPDGQKREFLVIDFWENDFHPSEDETHAQSLPVLVLIFNTRLRMLDHAIKHRQRRETPSLIAGLRALIARIPRETFAVKQLWAEIEPAWDDDFWSYLSSDRIALLRFKVGPLLRYAPQVDVQAETFISKVERLKEQIVLDVDTAQLAESIVKDVDRLSREALRNAEAEALWVWCRSYDRPLETATTAQLDQLIAVMARYMHLRKKAKALILDLPDFTETRGYIVLHGGTERVYVTEYKQRVQERIDALVRDEPTIHALMRGEAVTDQQLIALERTLRRELGDELDLSETTIRKVYTYKVGSLIEFVRRLEELDGIPDYAEIVTRQFEAYIAAHSFTADQIRFLRTVGSRLIERHQVTEADLYEPPFTYFGMDAVDRWFTDEQRADVLRFAASLAAIGA